MAPAGPSFLISLLARTLPTPISVYAALTFSPLSISNNLLAKITLSILSVIFEIFLRSTLKSIRQNAEMKRLGAQPIPPVKGSLPFNYDCLQKMLKEEYDGYLGNQVTQWQREIGNTFSIHVLGDTQIMTIEPENIKRILATDFNRFEKGPNFNLAMWSVLGVGVFNADDDMWKFHRTMTRPFFSRERISDFELFDSHWNKAATALRSRLGEKEAVDVQDLVGRFTLDSATDFLFGKSVEALSSTLPYPYNSPKSTSTTPTGADLFTTSFVNAQFTISHRFRVGWMWPLAEVFKDRTQKDMDVILGFIDPIISTALADKKEAEKVENFQPQPVEKDEDTHVSETETLLSYLVKCTDDKVIIRDETINILIAGRDTTAITLTSAIYMFCMHPEIEAKLRAEVMTNVGASRPPTYDDIRNMRYLRAFINEVLRLYPAVPFDVRASKVATTFPSTVPGEKPYYVPPNVHVNYSALVLHRSKEFWGPTALEFDPDRFLDERLGKYLTPNPFIFVPFNAGPRICLGQQFAYNEVSFFIIRLLQSFSSFTLAPDAQSPDSTPPAWWKNIEDSRAVTEKVWLKSSLTTSIKGGMWVRMTEAKETEMV